MQSKFAYAILALIFTAIILISIFTTTDNLHRNGKCSYHESLDLSDGHLQSDGSILHKIPGTNITKTFTPDAYIERNTIIKYNKLGEIIVPVKSYKRGCYCDNNPCVFFNRIKGENVSLTEEQLPSYLLPLADTHMHKIAGKCCAKYFQQSPGSELTKEGKFIFHSESGNLTYGFSEFFIQADYTNAKKPDFTVLLCDQSSKENKVIFWAVALSCISIVITLIIYIVVPKLCNMDGISMLCYLVLLVIGTIAHHMSTLEYFSYFSLQSAFFWLNLISFTLWARFRKFTQSRNTTFNKKKFLINCLYTVGAPFLLTMIIYTIDHVEILDEAYRPQLNKPNAVPKHGQFDMHQRIRLLYFYVPQFIVCILNMVFFVLAAIELRRVHSNINRTNTISETYKHQNNRLQSESEEFGVYLQLILTMGVTWIMESLGVFWLNIYEPTRASETFFMIFDLWNALQGLIVFIFIILRPAKIRLIKERFFPKSELKNETTLSDS